MSRHIDAAIAAQPNLDGNGADIQPTFDWASLPERKLEDMTPERFRSLYLSEPVLEASFTG